MPLPFKFDYKKPDFILALEWRVAFLKKLRKTPEKLPVLKKFYQDNPAQFIIDWGTTYDPRNPEKGQPALIPFLLFPAQEEWVEWAIERWKNGESGLTDKSRDMGASWLSVALAVTLCLFNKDLTIGFGSRKQEYVDSLGDPKTIIGKVREFTRNIPPEFRGSWDMKKHAPFMKCFFPDTNCQIIGESGDNLGRGGRCSIFFLDESAFMPKPKLVEAALSQNTNCRIDISTPCGRANPFAEKRFSGLVPVKTLHWRDHPAKDEDWYKRECEKIIDPVIIAQEIDINYDASVEGVVIPSEWVQSAVDSHLKLGIEATGARFTALDVADQGKDLNALASRKGVLLDFIEEWSGMGSDIFHTVSRTFALCKRLGFNSVRYDADGLGAGCRGDAKQINKQYHTGEQILFQAFRGSGAVINPKQDPFGAGVDGPKGRKNEDYFTNYKAQCWWALRRRFQVTHRAVAEGVNCSESDIISISSKLCDSNGKNLLTKLIAELSQPTYDVNSVGKILIEKAPDSTKSPNLADAVMMAFAPARAGGFFCA